MVLETVEEITEDNQSRGYEVSDHKLIFKNTYDSEEYGKERKFTINAKDEKSPDSFYYVHIDVDLDQIADCTCRGTCSLKCRQQHVPESETMANDPATPFFEISEEPNNESACTKCLNAFKSCFNC